MPPVRFLPLYPTLKAKIPSDILHFLDIVDALGHVSVRNPVNSSQFLMCVGILAVLCRFIYLDYQEFCHRAGTNNLDLRRHASFLRVQNLKVFLTLLAGTQYKTRRRSILRFRLMLRFPLDFQSALFIQRSDGFQMARCMTNYLTDIQEIPGSQCGSPCPHGGDPSLRKPS
jgi:hypothetical protein